VTGGSARKQVGSLDRAFCFRPAPVEVEVIRVLCCLLAGILSSGVPDDQDNAQRFEDASLTKAQQADILRVTGDQSDRSDTPGEPFIEFVHLSTDPTSPRQTLAWRGTGGMGNKDYWLFQSASGHLVLILHAGGSMYTSLPSVHHGMHDFITFWNMGGLTGGNSVYEFDGKQYHSAYCFETGPEKDGPHHPCEDH
jgi:hypothetical protein